MKHNRARLAPEQWSRLFARAAVGLAIACAVGPASANFSCSGRPANLTLSPSGYLSLSLIKADGSPVFQYAVLCSVQASHNDMEPANCRSIQALLSSAIALNKTVTFWFNDGPVAECSPTRFPAWQTLSTNNNWYFGPRLDD